jgi:Flp pilus assembly protein TadG
MKLKLRNLFDNQDGQAVAELALALPVLMLVVLAILDFGRAINYWNDETHVANLAARYAVVGTLPTTAQDPTCGGKATLTAYVQCEAVRYSPRLGNGSGTSTGPQGGVAVCVGATSNAAGSPVTLKVTTNYNYLPFLGSWTSTTIPISGTATMRLEQAMPAAWITSNSSC